jgi:hypothetical protein
MNVRSSIYILSFLLAATSIIRGIRERFRFAVRNSSGAGQIDVRHYIEISRLDRMYFIIRNCTGECYIHPTSLYIPFVPGIDRALGKIGSQLRFIYSEEMDGFHIYLTTLRVNGCPEDRSNITEFCKRHGIRRRRVEEIMVSMQRRYVQCLVERGFIPSDATF